MREVLIQLIIENLEIKRWLFKVDTEFGGRGTAYFDVTHLPCYHQTLMEFKKVGPTIWLKSKWMQVHALWFQYLMWRGLGIYAQQLGIKYLPCDNIYLFFKDDCNKNTCVLLILNLHLNLKPNRKLFS